MSKNPLALLPQSMVSRHNVTPASTVLSSNDLGRSSPWSDALLRVGIPDPPDVAAMPPSRSSARAFNSVTRSSSPWSSASSQTRARSVRSTPSSRAAKRWSTPRVVLTTRQISHRDFRERRRRCLARALSVKQGLSSYDAASAAVSRSMSTRSGIVHGRPSSGEGQYRRIQVPSIRR